jgi:hypothetical protein
MIRYMDLKEDSRRDVRYIVADLYIMQTVLKHFPSSVPICITQSMPDICQTAGETACTTCSFELRLQVDQSVTTRRKSD